MERYGISWNGERNCIATPIHDGYWTPWHEAQEQLAAANAQRDEMQCKLDELDIYLRCRGAAGETILARVQRIEHDVQAAVSFWQKAKTRGDLLQQHLDQCVRERDELAKSYRETIDDRDEWAAYAVKIMEKYGYPQECRDELMALITGLRGGVGP